MTRRCLGIFLLLFLLTGCSEIAFVDRITFVNSGDFPAHVEISGVDREGWIGIGNAQADSETSFEQVSDQGATWNFRFSYLDKHEEVIEVSREELEESDWTVEIPASFHSELEDTGATPPP